MTELVHKEILRSRAGSPVVARFEDGFARRLGIAHAVSFWKARVAFSAILSAAGIGPGDEVILPGYTCVAVPNAVLYAGARPIYVDINRATYNLDAAKVERRITPRTRALVVQHTYGIPCDVQTLRELARAYDLLLIEDSTHAIGSSFAGRPLGTLGDVAFFSFQWSKPFSTGLGGMAVTEDDGLAERARAVQSASLSPPLHQVLVLQLQVRLHRLLFRPQLYWIGMDVLHLLSGMHIFIGSSAAEELVGREPEGYQRRLSAFQAREGIAQLARLDDIVEHRRRISSMYERGLRDLDLPIVPPVARGDTVFLRYPLPVHMKAAVLREARRRHVEIGSWFASPLHPWGGPSARLAYEWGSCPVAEDAAAHVVNLPTHPRVRPDEAYRILDFIACMRRAGLVDAQAES